MRRMWTRHDLLRYAGAPVTGKNTMKKMWSLEELIKFNFLGNYDEATYDQYKDELNFSTMRKMWSLEMVVKHLYQKVINVPPKRYVQTTSGDFDANGDYTGTESYIILPEDKPSGYQIVNPNVIGVATNGDYLTETANMFRDNPSLYLELDYLNTSKVTYMYFMFRDSQMTTLDLSSFDTSKVTYMYFMFFGSKVRTLDLSSFDLSNVVIPQGIEGMFAGSQATTGYARTQEDADNFNNSSNKPAALVFEVK